MTKRAKLKLTNNEQNVEKQVASISSDAENTGVRVDAEQQTGGRDEAIGTSSAPAGQKPRRKTPDSEPDNDSTERDDEVSAEIKPALGGKILLKAAIVVGVTAAAVALYLYRRRFR